MFPVPELFPELWLMLMIRGTTWKERKQQLLCNYFSKWPWFVIVSYIKSTSHRACIKTAHTVQSLTQNFLHFYDWEKKKQKKNFSLYMCMSKKEVLSDLAQVQICPQNTVDTIWFYGNTLQKGLLTLVSYTSEH